MSSSPAKSWTRKWAPRLGIGALILIGFVLAIVAGGALYVATPSGSERLRAFVLRKVNAGILGEIEIKRLTFQWTHIRLDGVALKDPEGELVAVVESVDLQLRLSALIRRTAQIDGLLLKRPWVHLRTDDNGLNLARAFGPAEPSPVKPAQPKSSPPRFTFKLERLEIEDGVFRFEQHGGPEVREFQLSQLNLRSKAAYESPSGRTNLELSADGQLLKPEPGPLSVSLRGVFDGTRGKANASLQAAGLVLDASGQLSEPQKFVVRLNRFELPPAIARVFVSSYPLRAMVSAQGDGALHGETAAAKLQIRAASAQLELDGSLDISKYRSEGITVRARNVHLEELMANGPTTNIALDLHAEGGGTGVSDARGVVELTVPVSKWNRQRLGPINLRAKADHGTFEVTELIAVIPGAKLAASGRGTQQYLSASGKFTAVDLSETARAIGALMGGRAPRLAGSGNLDISARGPLQQLAVSAIGRFPTLRYENYRMTKIDLSVSVANLQKPFESTASVSAATFQVNEKLFKAFGAQLTSSGRDLDLQIRTSGFMDAALHAAGRVDADNRGILVSFFTLGYPASNWVLQKPSKLRFTSERTSADDLWLRSDNQSIRVAGALERGRLHALVDVVQLDLGRLPTPLFDPTLKLAGSLSAHISARGALTRPDVVARIDLQNGQFNQYKSLSLQLVARYQNDRAVGQFDASGFGSSAKSNFDFSPRGVVQHDGQPVQVSLQVDKADLSSILSALGRTDPLRGTIASKLEISGTGAEPHLKLALNGDSIQVAKFPALNFNLTAGTTEQGALAAKLEWQIQASKGTLSARSSLTLARLSRGMPKQAELVHLPINVDLDVHEFPLSLASQAGLIAQETQGKVSLTLQVTGTAAAPEGKANLVVAGATVSGLTPADLTLVATATMKGIETSVNVQRDGRRLVDAVGWIHGPLSKLQDPSALGSFPVSLKLTAGPIDLNELRSLSDSSSDPNDLAPRSPVHGLLMADLSLTGSLNDPQLTLRSQLERVGAGTQAAGEVKLNFGYSKGDSNLSVVLSSSIGGQMQIQGGTKLDLSLPAIRQGITLRTAPVRVTLRAQDFDISFLSGVVPEVRVISGTLIADADVSGTFGVPTLHGNLEWNAGRVAILGYGEYHHIHLLLNGDTQHVQIKELAVSSGNGNLRLNAQATRAGAGLTLNGLADLNQFPILSDGQLVATVTTHAQWDGEITHDLINIPRLSIPHAQIDLPEASPKPLQKLSRPDDIVVLKKGEPVDKQIARAKSTGRETSGFGGAGTATRTREIRITLDAPRNIWVKGSDLNVELGVAEGFHVSVAQQTTIFGDVRLLRGRVDVLGRRFDVQKDSDIRFVGPPTLPYLNVTAQYNNDREQVKVLVAVRGQGKDITIKPSSEPPLSESEIYTLIATGRRSLKQGSTATSSPSAQATSVVGSLAASELKKTLSSKLPLDVLSVEAGEQGGLTGTKFEAGRYFGDKIYIGYAGRLGADPYRGENSNAVRFEYQFTPRWEFDAEYGDARAGSADIVWAKDY